MTQPFWHPDSRTPLSYVHVCVCVWKLPSREIMWSCLQVRDCILVLVSASASQEQSCHVAIQCVWKLRRAHTPCVQLGIPHHVLCVCVRPWSRKQPPSIKMVLTMGLKINISVDHLELLIELVRQHPCIYDPNDPDHKDAIRVANIWLIGWTHLLWRLCLLCRVTSERARTSSSSSQSCSRLTSSLTFNILDAVMVYTLKWWLGSCQSRRVRHVCTDLHTQLIWVEDAHMETDETQTWTQTRK